LVLRISHAGPPSVRSQRLPLEAVLSAAASPSTPRANGNGHGHGKLLNRAQSPRR